MYTVSRPMGKKNEQGPRRDPIRIFIPAMSQIDVITNRIIALIFPALLLRPINPHHSHPRPTTRPRSKPRRKKNSPRKLVLEFFVPLSRLSAVESSGSRDQVQSIVIGFHRKLQGSRRPEVEAAAYLALPLAAKKRGKKEGGSAG